MRKLTDVFGKSRPSLNTWIFIPSLRLFSCGNCWSYSVHFHPKPHSLLSKCLFVARLTILQYHVMMTVSFLEVYLPMRPFTPFQSMLRARAVGAVYLWFSEFDDVTRYKRCVPLAPCLPAHWV